MIKSKNKSIIYNLLALALGCLVGCIFNVTGHTFVVDIFLAPFGSLYLRLLQFVALPMMFCLMLVSIISFQDVRKIISLSLKSIFANLISCIGVGIVSCAVTLFFVARKYLSLPTSASMSQIQTVKLSNYMDSLMNIVQSNVSGRFMQQNLVMIFVFSVLLGVIIATNREKLEYLAKFSTSLNLISMNMLGLVMRFAPIGIFAMTTDAFASNSLSVIGSLLGLVSMAFVISILSIALSTFAVSCLARKSFLTCLKAQAPAISFGFATSSSTACLLLVQDGAEKLGCNKETSSFVLPLVKMLLKPGGLLDTYCCLAFAIVASGKILPLSAWFYMIFIATIFSPMAYAIPMGGIFIIPTALLFMGLELPENLVGVLVAVYLFIDMCGTGMTSSLDILSVAIVDKLEKRKNKTPYGDGVSR